MQLARKAVPLEIPGQTELVRVRPHRAREIDRPPAHLILDRLQHDHVRALEILAAQLLRVEHDRHTAQAHRLLLAQPVHRLQRVPDIRIGIAEELAIRLGPRATPIDRRRSRGVEGRERPALQLPEIPVRVRERQVHDRHVLADVLDFLRVPQGERVVVSRGHEHAVRLHRLQQIGREVARERFPLPRRREMVPHERDEREQQHRRGHHPASLRVGLAILQRLVHPFHQRGEPHPHPDSPQRERRDEEVIPLAHLALQLRVIGRPRVAVLEVQVEDQDQGEGGHERGHRDRRAQVRLEVAVRAEAPDDEEQHGEPGADLRAPVAAPLPREVLDPHPDLRREGRLALPHRRLPVLLAREHVPQRRPVGRLTFVDRREVGRADRQEQIDRYADHRDDQHRDREVPVPRLDDRVAQRAKKQHGGELERRGALEPARHDQRVHAAEHQPLRPLDPARPHVARPLRLKLRKQQHHHHGPDQHAHHVIRGRERQQVHDHQQMVIVPLAQRLVVPAHDEPEHERHGEERERVDLLVHHRLVPHRERRGRDERPRHRGQPARPAGRHPAAHPALAHEEPAPRRDRARDPGEQVDPLRVVRHPRYEAPRVSDEHEQRVAGRVGDAEDVCGRDVLRRVPELGGRGERRDIDDQGAEGDEAREEIGRALA